VSEDTTEADVDVATDDVRPERIAQRFWRPVGTQRVLQVVLGIFWLLDAALQFQPFMLADTHYALCEEPLGGRSSREFA
jgi:hypothetical protein